jgi:cyclic pyranopterin phosphate synthase
MIDISDKKIVRREAIARGTITLKAETIQKIKKGEIKKGDPLIVARVAAVNAVKQTPLLIPFCHQIPIASVNVDFDIHDDSIETTVTVKAVSRTGVEMESLIGVTNALNTIWDMVKYLEKDEHGQYPGTRIDNIRVTKKTKGQLSDSQ